MTRTRDTERMPATAVAERHIDAGPFRTRYLEAGDPSAPRVLLLHDGTWGGASSVTWGAAMPLLARRFHVLAPDLLGYGGTDKVVFVDRSQYEARLKHVEAFVAATGARGPLHLIGSSFGASLCLRALTLGTTLPVASISVIGGTGGPWKTALQTAELSHWDGTETDLRRIVALLMDPESPSFEEQVRERFRWAATVGHYRAISAVRSPLPEAMRRERDPDPWPTQLEGVDVPVLLVAGTADLLLQPEWPEHLREVLPHARVERIGGRHSPNLDQLDVLVPLVSGFVSENS